RRGTELRPLQGGRRDRVDVIGTADRAERHLLAVAQRIDDQSGQLRRQIGRHRRAGVVEVDQDPRRITAYRQHAQILDRRRIGQVAARGGGGGQDGGEYG